MPSIPIVKTEIQDILALPTSTNRVIDLFDHFDDPFTTGLTARFELENKSLGGGITHVVLYDQADQGAPLSVENFLNYVEDGDYVNSIIHRSVPNFVVQGGGFVVDDLAANLRQETPENAVTTVPADPPVQNEFSAERSNTRGTLAYAKIGPPDGQPPNDATINSATNGWFFNLNDNSANLNNQNGGFTVFGEVVSEADLVAVDAIATVPTFNGSNFFVQGAFSNLPLLVDDPQQPTVFGNENLIRYQSITTFQQEELSFEIIGNSNPDLLSLTLDEETGELTVDYQPEQVGVADITIEATTLQGETVTDQFRITVKTPTASIKLNDFNRDKNSDVLLRSAQGGAAQVVSLEQTQLNQIRAVGPTIRDENWQIQGSGQFNDDEITDWVWRNQRTGQGVIWLMGSNAEFEAAPLSAVALDAVTNLDLQIRATGDLNDDNQSDLIWFNESTSEALVWYINNGERVDEDTLQLSSVNDKTLIGSGDFDGDDDFELLWQDIQTGGLFTQELNDLVGADLQELNSTVDSEGVGEGWVLGAIADYTIDSRSDIAWYNEAQGLVKIWEINGNTVVNSTSISVS